MAFMTLASPIETQLRKVVPELRVNDVPERAARCDPLLDCLQPFDENFVDIQRTSGEGSKYGENDPFKFGIKVGHQSDT